MRRRFNRVEDCGWHWLAVNLSDGASIAATGRRDIDAAFACDRHFRAYRSGRGRRRALRVIP